MILLFKRIQKTVVLTTLIAFVPTQTHGISWSTIAKPFIFLLGFNVAPKNEVSTKNSPITSSIQPTPKTYLPTYALRSLALISAGIIVWLYKKDAHIQALNERNTQLSTALASIIDASQKREDRIEKNKAEITQLLDANKQLIAYIETYKTTAEIALKACHEIDYYKKINEELAQKITKLNHPKDYRKIASRLHKENKELKKFIAERNKTHIFPIHEDENEEEKN
ncbi:MAG: hypothetical protein NTX86_04665 [Candidatus Dependentiae bacterium]|nr:hypothetical protein [Candidatus Dependentiae bacterium]